MQMRKFVFARFLAGRIFLALGILLPVCGCCTNGECDPPSPPVSEFDDEIRTMLDSTTNANSSAGQLEAAFFHTAETQGGERAIAELDQAIANQLRSQDDLLRYIERSSMLGGRLVDPEAADLAGEVNARARRYDVDRDTAKFIIAREGAAASRNLCGVSAYDATVIFVNGIATTHAEFVTSLFELRRRVREAGIPRVRVLGVYNISSVDWQRSTFHGVVCPAFATLSQTGVVGFELCQRLGGVDLIEASIQYGTEWRVGTGNVNEVRDAVRAEVASGRIVVLVGHSQGNFFVRDAINQLGSDSFGPYSEAVGVIEVASPASTMPQPSTRIDMCPDPVARLSSRFSLAQCIASSAGAVGSHSFVKSYLDDSVSRSRVVQAIRDYQGSLQNPRVDLGSGIIQFTLQWDNAADVDLHVREPGGQTVYYGRRVGDYGQLDRDDRDGYGPENYFVCNELPLQSGDFTASVRHYSGPSPAGIMLRVRAGPRIREFTGTVSASADLEGIATVHYENGDFTIR